MLCVIRTTGLDEAASQRLRLATSLLGAFQMQAHVAEWDGSRCHLLVAALGNGDGRAAMARALERGIAVLGVGPGTPPAGVPVVDAETSASMLARHIRDRVRAAAPPQAAAKLAKSAQASLCRLAQPPLRGKAVLASRNGRVVHLVPQSGRVYAATHSDLLAATESLAGPGWSFEVTERSPAATGSVSASLESFLAEAACRGAAQLPPFPEGRYHLDAWPDLGSAPALVGALRVTWQLIGKAQTPADLVAAIDGLGPREVDACLWAFAAADLLRASTRESARDGRTEARMEQGTWTRLARRFGLLRS